MFLYIRPANGKFMPYATNFYTLSRSEKKIKANQIGESNYTF